MRNIYISGVRTSQYRRFHQAGIME